MPGSPGAVLTFCCTDCLLWNVVGACVLLFWDLARRYGSRDSVTEWKQLSFTSCTQVPPEFPDLN